MRCVIWCVIVGAYMCIPRSGWAGKSICIAVCVIQLYTTRGT